MRLTVYTNGSSITDTLRVWSVASFLPVAGVNVMGSVPVELRCLAVSMTITSDVF